MTINRLKADGKIVRIVSNGVSPRISHRTRHGRRKQPVQNSRKQISQ